MEKYWKLSIFIILIPTPDFPHFYYMLGGNLGSLLYGDVSVMIKCVLNYNRNSEQQMHRPVNADMQLIRVFVGRIYKITAQLKRNYRNDR